MRLRGVTVRPSPRFAALSPQPQPPAFVDRNSERPLRQYPWSAVKWAGTFHDRQHPSTSGLPRSSQVILSSFRGKGLEPQWGPGLREATCGLSGDGVLVSSIPPSHVPCVQMQRYREIWAVVPT
jgi:hypothetical protein